MNYQNQGCVFKQGLILPDKHPADPGLYKVYFGDLTASSTGVIDDGMWASNSISSYTRYRDLNNNPITYGSHTPLQPYTPVNVLIPNGGKGQPVIMGLAHTNVSVPDPNNRDDLYLAFQTPKGSVVAADDKKDNISILFRGGESSIVLAENNITLELSKGEQSGKAHDTSLSLSKGSFIFKMRDAMMKFDETGFIIGFDSEEGNEHSSYLQITRDGIDIYGKTHVKLNSDEYLSNTSREVVINGTKDTSVTSSHLRLNGTQLTSIKGYQMELESTWLTAIKSMHINLQAISVLKEETAFKHSIFASENKTIAGEYAEFSMFHNVLTTNFNVGAAFVFLDEVVTEESGVGMTAAGLAYSTSLLTMETEWEAAMIEGVIMLDKNPLTAELAKGLGGGPLLAGSGKVSETPVTMTAIAKDTSNKKSINSTASTYFFNTNRALEHLSVISPLLQSSLTAYYTNGLSPVDATSQKKSLLESSIIYNKQSGNVGLKIQPDYSYLSTFKSTSNTRIGDTSAITEQGNQSISDQEKTNQENQEKTNKEK